MNALKKKKGWLACVLFLLGTLATLISKKDKHKKQVVYKFSFHLQDKDTETQVLSAENASAKITSLLKSLGCASAEFQSYAIENGNKTDSRDTLVFAVILPPEKKAREVLEAIKCELNLTHAWYIKEEHSYQELKKELR